MPFMTNRSFREGADASSCSATLFGDAVFPTWQPR